jgi:YVTN family beta-propeller protein
MLALYRSGRQAEALEVYRDARRTLADELGLEPSPTLQQLERAILSHDPALQAPMRQSPRERARRKGALLIAAGAVVLVAAAITVAVIELTGTRATPGLASVAADSVGVIDPGTNRIVGQIPVGSDPSRIAFAPSGVWVVSEHDKTVTRIDPASRTALRTFSVGGPPIDVAVSGNDVWLLLATPSDLAGGPARVARIDPDLNDVVKTRAVGSASLGFGSGPDQSLAAGGGALWVASPLSKVGISRIDTVTEKISTFSVGGPSYGFNSGSVGGGPGSSGIVFGAGALWVGTDAGVIRINPESRVVSKTIGLGVVVPTALAVGEDAVWVVARPGFRCCPAETVGTGTLTRIDPATNSVKETRSIGGYPSAIAVGEGAVWIADPRTRSVVRFDPKKNRIVRRIKVGARPRGITVGDGFVWVSVG